MELSIKILKKLINNPTNKSEKILYYNSNPNNKLSNILIKKSLDYFIECNKNEGFKLIYIYTVNFILIYQRNRIEEYIDISKLNYFNIINATNHIVKIYSNQLLCNLNISSIFDTLKSILLEYNKKVIILFDTMDILFLKQYINEFKEFIEYINDYKDSIFFFKKQLLD